jgi:excinuclease ABC subunit A
LKKNIKINNAKIHNLKNVSIEIPRNKFTVVTGVSGSGKSSLIFDTLYAEGQRRYVESLSSYARQFLGRMEKPDVDSIEGLTPCIAIEQKVNTANPRSTVATTTELYDYLKILWLRAGITISPVSGGVVKKHSVSDVVDFIQSLEKNLAVYITYKLQVTESIDLLISKGFTRLWRKEETLLLEDLSEKLTKEGDEIIVDRFKAKEFEEEDLHRFADSVDLAFWEGKGFCNIRYQISDGVWQSSLFDHNFSLDQINFIEPTIEMLSFNNPYGACDECQGFGNVIGIDENLVIPNKNLSLYDGAVVAWKGDTMQEWKNDFIRKCSKYDFPIHRPIRELTKEQYNILWNGKQGLYGIQDFFDYLQENSYKIQYRVMAARYRGKTKCNSCNGTRLRKDVHHIKLINENKNPEFLHHPHQVSLIDVLNLNIAQATEFFDHIKLEGNTASIAKPLIIEIKSRLHYLMNVGLGYLGLGRVSSSLSGGESQRVNLATSLGSSLVGSTYILDEPSIGLHSRDTQKLLGVLNNLKDKGNTVIVVEHDEDVIKNGDQIIDIGPLAGSHGGKVTFNGKKDDIASADTLTAQYINGIKKIEVPKKRRKVVNKIIVQGASLHNLKFIDVVFPLNMLVAVSGVSGSGKTSLIKGVLYPSISRQLNEYYSTNTGEIRDLVGDYSSIQHIELIDQNPLGKSSRSNPVTYIKAYDAIRELYANRPLAKQRGYKTRHFSFNVEGGRCPTCLGEGVEEIEMQFMANIKLKCEECQGKRFISDVLEIEYQRKNINDVLEMTVEDALQFFSKNKQIVDKLQCLFDVGLGYIKLGQSSSTLSGGEAQRVKLASFISKKNQKDKILFIFDEPTTGLHFNDVKILLDAFEMLINQGHSIIVIEHNIDVIKCADYVIDIGPEAGELGGEIVFQGTPEELIKNKNSATAEFLSEKI